MRRLPLRWFAVALWLTIAAVYLSWLSQSGKSPMQLLIGALSWLRNDPLGPLAFIAVFVARPVIFVPASLLAVTAGHCFGVVWGEIWALLAGILAAALVYTLGRAWPPSSPQGGGRFAQFERQLAARGVETTAAMRVAMLPYDPCSFLCGRARVAFSSFMLGSFLGNLPGTTSCVLFGAGFEGEFTGQLPAINWKFQGGAVVLMILAFGLSRWVRSRKLGETSSGES